MRFKPGHTFRRGFRGSAAFPLVFRAGGGGSRAAPSAPAFTLAPGAADGSLDVTVIGLPASWGDAASPGDGAGTAGELWWWEARTGWQLLTDDPDTGTWTIAVDPLLQAKAATIRVRGVSAQGRVGAFDSDVATVPGPALQLRLIGRGGHLAQLPGSSGLIGRYVPL